MQHLDAGWWYAIWTWVSPAISATALVGAGAYVLYNVVSWYGSIHANKKLEQFKAALTADNNKELERLKATLTADNNKELERLKATLTEDMMQRLERLKGEIHVDAEKYLHMQKVQFDTEFKIYQELWSKLRAVRGTLQRASFYKVQAEQPSGDWADRRNKFDTAVRALAEVAEDQRPFFAARIASDLFALLDLADQGLEITEAEKSREMQSSGPQRRTVSREVTHNLDAIEHAANRLCESIRERVTGTENAIN